jgi:hypothetical protein
LILGIAIKPGLAQQVDPGPDQPGGWIGPGKVKDQQGQKNNQILLTRQVDS